MDWATEFDAALCGETHAARVLDVVSLAYMLGEHDPDKTACAVPRADNTVALCRVVPKGLACLAIVPLGEVVLGEIDAARLFAKPWPAHWITKRNIKRGEMAHTHPGYEAGWACGVMSSKAVVLARVVAHDGATLLRVKLSDDAPDMDVTSHDAVKWWPLGQHAEGLERLWSRNITGAPNYGLLVQWAKRVGPDKPARESKTGRKRPDLTSEEQRRRSLKAWDTRRAKLEKKFKAAKKAIDRAD